MFSLVIGATSLEHAYAALESFNATDPTEKGNEYKILSALNFNQLYQVPNSLGMLIVLFYVLIYMRATQEERDEDLEAQAEDKLDNEDDEEEAEQMQQEGEAISGEAFASEEKQLKA